MRKDDLSFEDVLQGLHIEQMVVCVHADSDCTTGSSSETTPTWFSYDQTARAFSLLDGSGLPTSLPCVQAKLCE